MTDITIANLTPYAKGKINLWINGVTDTANSYCEIHPNLQGIKVFVASHPDKEDYEYVILNKDNIMAYHTRFAEDLVQTLDLLAGNKNGRPEDL